jgi:acetylcholinesterase
MLTRYYFQIPFVFANPEQDITPLGNSSANVELAHLVNRMWTSFAYDLDPNGHGSKFFPNANS